ncbi:MAG: carboxypeptidase regulatory-like domain-containing protein [Terriglobales bacterium]
MSLVLLAPGLFAQSLTTGAISGRVSDLSGAVVPGAAITATNVATGAVRKAVTTSVGVYTFAQLDPGNYDVKATAKGFQAQQQGPVAVTVGQVANVVFRLQIGTQEQTVQVTEQAPLLQPDNPDTATAVDQTQIANVPNSGNDLTFEAQFAPGAVMNATGGYGNVEFNGLSTVSNNFTLDGLDNNNPNLNLNGSGSTNLQLGLNDVQEVTVNTDSFGADHGRQAGAQMTYVSKAGGNQFHGNLFELWNGRAMNSNDYFLNMEGTPRPFSNVNQFGGSVGGPVVHKKLFFFYDIEAVRIALPVLSSITVPSPGYETYALNQLTQGGYDPTRTSTSYCPSGTPSGTKCAQPLPSNPAEVPFYQEAFKLYRNTNIGSPKPISGCQLNPGDATATIGYNPLASPTGPTGSNPVPDGTGCGNQTTVAASSHTNDRYELLRLDYDRSPTDSYWLKGSYERGLQATHTDPINPIFNATSNQPEVTSSAGWTHIFNPNLINQFNPGLTWGDAIFGLDGYQTTLATLGIQFRSPFYELNRSGGFPGGYNTTVWELNDNLSWIRGAHTFKFGVDHRRVDISQLSGRDVVPNVLSRSLPEFTYGVAYQSNVGFVASTDEPEAYYNLDLYGMDTWHLARNLTLTYGLRLSHNSNPVNQHDLNSRLKGDWSSITHDVNQPLGPLFATGQHQEFTATPALEVQPRFSLAYGLNSRTLLKAGWGMFEDVYPGAFGARLFGNPPNAAVFQGGLFGQVGGEAVAPGVPNSAIAAAQQANANFQSLFANGGLSCAAAGATAGNCINPISATAFPNSANVPPMIYEWRAEVERQITRTLALNLAYSGTRSTRLPYSVQENGYETACAGCFAPFAYNAAPDARFNGFTQWNYGASGNYNGLQVSFIKHMGHGLMFNANYTWSHCLDEISNGGIYGFGGTANYTSPLPGELRRQYGDCDYDIPNTFNADYVYRLPFHANGWLGHVADGWQLSGTVFLHGGLPVTMVSSTAGGTFNNTDGPMFAYQVPGQSVYAKQPINGVTQAGEIQWFNPSAFISAMDSSTGNCVNPSTGVQSVDAATCQFGNLGRNTLRGPGFLWSDLSLAKFFQVSEKVRFKAEVDAYNFLNHPNFSEPSATAGVPGDPSTLSDFGTINSLMTPPTSILGFGLGGDDSVRMIALQGKIVF